MLSKTRDTWTKALGYRQGQSNYWVGHEVTNEWVGYSMEQGLIPVLSSTE
jgi:hypothetical protein